MTGIPTTQKAAYIEDPGPNGRLVFKDDAPVNEPGEYEVLVKLECSGICHSDVRVLLGWGAYSHIPGHEGIGRVVSLGPESPQDLLGKRVGIKWLYSACGTCSTCTSNPPYPNNCANQRNTGRSVTGTLQQYCVADSRYVSLIPDGLASEVAAPLLCAGLSLAGAISRLSPELKRGDWLVLLGAGGGLGHLGLQIAARVKEYRVIAVDTGDDKRKLCAELGAEEFVDFAHENVEARVKALTNGEGAHGTVVVPGSEAAYALAPKLVRSRGVIVCVGLPKATFHIPLSPIECSGRGLVIKGSSVGNEQQMEELFQFALDGTVLPRVQVSDFSKAGDILNKLKNDEVTGRMVVTIPQ